ncbi:hypothetical protein L596_030745 [Steinernema carpocapsae]|uniref:G-protein coupled receptors family 1 profile domain-containing protein n=1 Tax=Steinernema carpocapsae TaxID=34508 RepID=A0A4U5LNN1_STECR|nr:hypothetical protein L596_030745 [Steinernema carpocapsae]
MALPPPLNTARETTKIKAKAKSVQTQAPLLPSVVSSTVVSLSPLSDMNGTSHVSATLGTRLFGGLSYALLSLTGVTLNLLLCMVLIKGRAVLKTNAFYTITWQMVVCDLLTHGMEFIVPIPITIAGSDMYGKTMFLYIPAFVDTIAYTGTLYFSFLMTLNRFTVFVFPQVNQFLFQKPRLFITIGVVWVYIIVFVGAMNALSCYKSFDSFGFFYYHKCPDWNNISVPGQVIKSVSVRLHYKMFKT